jgi:hypothetical protein
MGRRALVGVCVLALVVAGCQAPVATSTTEITVTNGTLGVDPGSLYDRLQGLSGTAVPAPDTIRAFDSFAALRNASGGGGGFALPRFQEVVGFTTGGDPFNGSREQQLAGSTSGLGTVTVFPGANATRDDERLILAHELTHYIQFQSDVDGQLQRAVGATTTEGSYLTRAVLEGGAVFTTDTYLARYGDSDLRNTPLYDRIARGLPPGSIGRYGNSQYVFGNRYVAAKAETPADLPAIYANPPRTAEQLIHRLDPGSEPPVPLTVATDGGEAWLAVGEDRLGEAFVRYALEGELSPDRAARAAAGWGNDTLRTFRSPSVEGTGYAWVLRWDDAANATEFERAAREYFTVRANDTTADGLYRIDDSLTGRLSTPTDRTAVLWFGPRAFVANASADGADGAVEIRVRAPR